VKTSVSRLACSAELSPIRLRDLRPGDRVTGSAGWTCIGAGAVRVVQRGQRGLFVACSQGRHYLEFQCMNFFDGGEDDIVVGMSRAPLGSAPGRSEPTEPGNKPEESKE